MKRVYDTVAVIRKKRPTPASVFPKTIAAKSTITPAPLEGIFGTKGQAKDGMFKVTFGRAASMHGISVGKEMGVNTWAAFAGSDAQAVVDGDFAMSEAELQPVLKSMRADSINIVAIHQHMLDEQPRIMFLHYWGKGSAQELAKAVKHALDAQTTMHASTP